MLLISYCNRAFEKLPGQDLFPIVSLCLLVGKKKIGYGGSEVGVGQNPKSLTLPTYKEGSEGHKAACGSQGSRKQILLLHFLFSEVLKHWGWGVGELGF